MPSAGFAGREVIAFENRRQAEMTELIRRFGGRSRVAPALREARLEENSLAFAFGDRLLAGQIDLLILLTGVGAQALLELLETRHGRQELLSALARVPIVVRGPKPLKVISEWGLTPAVVTPEPNTWHEMMTALAGSPLAAKLRGKAVAVQEYGVAPEPLIQALEAEGARVLRVPVYRWALPDDLAPLRGAIDSIVSGEGRILLFTNRAQVDHLMRVAKESGLLETLHRSLCAAVVASIGPSCTEELRRHGITPDIEPKPAKMGALVHEAAQQAGALLEAKALPPRRAGTESNTGPGVNAARRQVAERISVEVVDEVAGAAEPPWLNSRFMRACRREPVDLTPVWLMRQAGRYMKDYRELRERVPFLDLCKNPDLVAEVTIGAANKIGADAAIIFADLLLIAEPMGFTLEYEKGEGPRLSPPIRHANQVNRLRQVNPEESLGYLMQAIRLTRAQLDPAVPLIGFCGAPFTLASYLIEGGGTRTFRRTKALMYSEPAAWHALLAHLSRNLIRYANAQIAAGVQALQVFDSWVGCLGPADYREFVLPHSRSLLQGIDAAAPVIHFGVGTGTLLEAFASAGGSVIGVDSHVELDHAWARVGDGVAVQGNLDPAALFAPSDYIRNRVIRILKQAGGRAGHIFNLGHGILPDTPFEHVAQLVQMVHEESRRLRSAGAFEAS